MKKLLLVGVFAAYLALVYFFKDESFIFKTVIFFIIAVPIFFVLFIKVFEEQQNRMKELEDRVYELENKKR